MALETKAAAPLEDLMVAMDVVDTLRHRDQLIDRELDGGARRERLIEKLRDIYAAQGIAVTDAMLEEGVSALEEDRFAYKAPAAGFSTSLAKLYVRREHWLKPLLFLFFILALIWGAFYALVLRPQAVQESVIPADITRAYEDVMALAQEDDVREQAAALAREGEEATLVGKYDEAKTIVDQLKTLSAQLGRSYQVRVVNKSGERSGVWRIPDVNTQARNYYVVVEAIDPNGRSLRVPVLSEETGVKSKVKRWAIRVNKVEFDRIAADKQDDGIIQANKVGKKSVGYMRPEYKLLTSGGAITEW